jgi:hypothetical protein
MAESDKGKSKVILTAAKVTDGARLQSCEA